MIVTPATGVTYRRLRTGENFRHLTDRTRVESKSFALFSVGRTGLRATEFRSCEWLAIEPEERRASERFTIEIVADPRIPEISR